ncbi:MAG: ferredoxin [Acidimicrobiia bacterium]
MKLVVDLDKCQGHGKCYLVAPGLFEPEDDWGRPRVTRPTIDDDDLACLDLAEEAVSNCPEQAIRLEVSGIESSVTAHIH